MAGGWVVAVVAADLMVVGRSDGELTGDPLSDEVTGTAVVVAKRLWSAIN